MIRAHNRATMDAFKRCLSGAWETHPSDFFLRLSFPDM